MDKRDSPGDVEKKRSPKPKDPLHGVTLEMMLQHLLERFGWERMGEKISIRCFLVDPSIKSSLSFLRKTPWARQKVEDWYAYDVRRFGKLPEKPTKP